MLRELSGHLKSELSLAINMRILGHVPLLEYMSSVFVRTVWRACDGAQDVPAGRTGVLRSRRGEHKNDIGAQNWAQFIEDVQELFSACLRAKSRICQEHQRLNAAKTVFASLLHQLGDVTLEQWLYRLCKALCISSAM